MKTKEFYLAELKKYGIIAGNKDIKNLERLYKEYVLPKKERAESKIK